jgi:hypothetical protein
MTALDDLKAAIAALEDSVKQLDATAQQCDKNLAAAYHANSVAKQAHLKTMARPVHIHVEGKESADPVWIKPSDAVINELKRVRTASAVNVGRCEEAKKVAGEAVKAAKDELDELERNWPPDLGPFPA